MNDPFQTRCASRWIDKGVDEASRITPAFWARLRRQPPSEVNIGDKHGYGSIWPRWLLQVDMEGVIQQCQLR